MRNTSFYLVCGVLLIAVLLQPVSTGVARKVSPKIQLLETGVFHGNEVKARTGERWLGLCKLRSGFALCPSTIAVEPVFDPVVDDDGTPKKSGKKVTVQRNRKPIFLIKGAAMLRPGPVVTVFEDEKSLGNAASVNLQLNGKRYQLKVIGNNPKPSDYLIENSKLFFTDGETTQILMSMREPSDAGWHLLWAGDIDRDGKLDLYLDLSDHYNISSRQLFLSSQAGKGKLVKELARFVTSGC